MTCCMVPNHNVINPVYRIYIEVENTNEKK